jgi:hypothetical protein
MAYTEAQRDALKEALALGATKVRYRDREVTYRSLDEMKELLRDIERELEAQAGRCPPRRTRQVRFVTRSGLC